MRIVSLLAVMFVLVLATTGCYSAPVVPPVGMLYSDIDAPLTTEYSAQNVTMKEGMASSMSILGLIAWGDCSVEAAAKAGSLGQVNYADYHYFNVLGVYQKFTVKAYGQ
jgi:hypothetical protein